MKGRLLANATKRREAIAYAKSILPAMRMAVAGTRRPDRPISLTAVARHLNEQEPRVRSSGDCDFAPTTVSRILNGTEVAIEKNARQEYDFAVELLRVEAERTGKAIDASVKAALAAQRDQDIEEGKALGRRLRCMDGMEQEKPTLEDAARLIVHQLEHHRRYKRWDLDIGQGLGFGFGFNEWALKLLSEALPQ
ncbi:hypothetical protein [Sphingomonas aerolata]|uniref:hypothetical protein n=1 Tax=Sphingomonas aerolata TaxID=185951 RepID=UPI002FE41E27